METTTAFGNSLARLRKVADLSLRELASRLGLSAGYLSQLENGKQSISGLPSCDTLHNMAIVLQADETALALSAGKVSKEILDPLLVALQTGKITKADIFKLIEDKTMATTSVIRERGYYKVQRTPSSSVETYYCDGRLWEVLGRADKVDDTYFYCIYKKVETGKACTTGKVKP